MPIRTGTLRIGRQLRTTIGTEADNATRALATAWASAWDTLSADMEAAIAEAMALAGQLGRWPTPYELRRVTALHEALLNAQEALVNLGERAGVTITDAAGNAVHATADTEPNLIASQLPAAERAAAAVQYAANILPSALDVIVSRTSQQIASSIRPLSGEAVDAMNRELVRGVGTGSNPRTAGAQMLDNLHDGFNGGLSRAVNIARTEILDAYRTTSQYAHRANADVLAGWIWLCTLSARTCPSCIAMNGSVHDLSEAGPLDHQAGRCARMPMLKPWSELGISIPEPASTIPDARQWVADQTPEVQRQILGNQRWQMLQSGRITWDQIPARRESGIWRPSYVPRSAQDLQRIAGPATRPVPEIPATQRTPALPRRTRYTPPTPATTVTKLGTNGRPLAGDMVVTDWSKADAARTAIEKAYAEVLDGTYAGLTVKTSAVEVDRRITIATGDIVDSHGAKVGTFGRALHRESDDTLVATHALLTLDADVHGQGFAEAFNNHLEDWYRASGVDRIELVANISVGGYAWARSGYDFKDADGARDVLKRLGQRVTAYDNTAEAIRLELERSGSKSPALAAKLAQIEAQITAADNILGDALKFRFGELGFPSAYRISQAGRWSGATRSDMWIGKDTMLGSYWEGVKPL